MESSTKPSVQRIGKIVEIEDKTFEGLKGKITEIKEELKKYGLIVIKNAKIDAEELEALTKLMGNEVVKLPKEMLRDNFEPNNPSIVRIGNLYPDGR